MNWSTLAGLALVPFLAACAGDVAGGDARGSGGSNGTWRIPENHRPAGSTCPEQRGPNSVSVDGCQTNSAVGNGAYVLCTQDSDCTAGTNGRCFAAGPMACMTICSYDTCFSDSDCPSNQPCECRSLASDSSPNACLTEGNCRIDADCGQGGYCSPSQVNNSCFCPSPALCPSGTSCSPGPCACGDSCGHGYFCHTAADTCIDDSDCDGGTCNYDTVNHRWDCAACWVVP